MPCQTNAMNPEGDQGESQSGFNLQNVGTMSPHNGKRCRDESEEGRHPTPLGMDSQCVKAMDLNVSSDIVSGEGGEDGREDQGSFLNNNLSLFQSEKRIKCGPSNFENNSQSPIPSSPTANKDVLASDCGKAVSLGMTSQKVSQEDAAVIVRVSDKVAEADMVGIEGVTQFRCDICSVKSTSTIDLETHLAGKRHARAKELALGMGTSSIIKSAGVVPQNVQASTEHDPVHSNSNLPTTSMGQQVLADGAGEASKGHTSSDTTTGEVNFWATPSKCPDLNDAKAVAMGQHTSIDCSFRDFLKDDPPSKIGFDNGDNRNSCQHVMDGTIDNLAFADGLLEKVCSRFISEGDPHKHLMASLSAKSNSDCVARALASALSTHGCPGLGDLQEGGSCEQAAGCSDSQLEIAKSGGGIGMVTMHTRCFSNLLHDVQVCVMEDLLLHGGLKTNTWLSNAIPISSSAPSGEDLNCSVCRVEYGSKADLDLHLAGKRHASLVQRVYSRCQLCNLNCNTEKDFKVHLSGKKHASKLRLVQKRVTF